MRPSIKISAYIILYLFLLSFNTSNFELTQRQSIYEDLFKEPNKDSYPETWYHFIGGNVSKQGITADLEAIAAAGISGIQLFHGQFGGEWPGVSPQIEILSESWDDLVLWTAQECKRLNLSFTMQNCPGWSYAGGPWIEPENSMRHLIYSRTDVKGGEKIELQLTKPQPSEENWRNYKDLFIIAFPTPEGDTGERLTVQKIESNRDDLDWNGCLNEQKAIKLSGSKGQPTTLNISFTKNTTLRTIEFPPINSFSHAWCYSPGVTVTVYAISSNEKQKIAHIDMPSSNWQDNKPITIACSEALADSYLMEITNLHDMALSYINFYSAARQQNWESEAAWTLRRIVREEYPEQDKKSWLNSSQIMNISEKMDSSGVISWDVPEGNWTILRLGHINTGKKNGPAPAAATGWEANKLSVEGIRANFNGYIGRLTGKTGVLHDGLLKGVLLDSWECETQTWTKDLDISFKDKWKYALHSMLPALFGYIIDNPENTARFLRDWRVTLNDLLVENFFGEMKKMSDEKGLKVSFETASGDVFPGDILEYYKYADTPMCEFWQPRMESFVGSIEFKSVKPTVSAARVYGKKRVAAEALTSFNLSWNENPRFLKDFVDDHFAKGVTHLVFHTYTHNPRTDFLPPSTSFGTGIGTPFLRLQTWWQHMPLFTKYIARCNYMLESGNPVSDVLMYLGDEQNHKPSQLLPFPEGYLYDYCNPDVLLNRLSVKNGQIVTPEGLSYRVLWLYDCKRMLPETLEKIASFVENGLIVVGEPPTNLATLSGGTDYELRFKNIITRLWGDNFEDVRTVGKGKVYRGSLNSVLAAENIQPDLISTSSDLRWLHRQTDESDFYFLSTPPDKGYKGNISFRSKGIAEIWNPLTGDIIATNSKNNRGYTEIDIDLPAETSCFVVFRKRKSNNQLKQLKFTTQIELNEPWKIKFPEGWGIENPSLPIKELTAWKNLPLTHEGKSFSGTASYSTTFAMDKKSRQTHYFLDLGKVETIAKVTLNEKEVGTCWTTPYKLDITQYLRPGINTLQVDVTSTWYNRLVYDAGLPEEERKTWTIAGPSSNQPLKEYGLLGPVFVELREVN